MHLHRKFIFLIVGGAFVFLNACKEDGAKSEIQEEPETEKINPSEDIIDEPEEIIDYNTAAMIDLSNIDHELLDQLVMDGINYERERKGIKPLSLSGVLIAAAKIQTEYQIKMNGLSHYQKTPELKTVGDRVKYFGGYYRGVGENVQFQGFTIRTYGNKEEIITTSYEEAARNIVNGWINSPGHYGNLINPDYDYVGTSVLYSPKKKALFATQVYGHID